MTARVETCGGDVAANGAISSEPVLMGVASHNPHLAHDPSVTLLLSRHYWSFTRLKTKETYNGS